MVICTALCFAQAANYFDKDGGPYLYAREAFGEFVGFEVGFVTWAIRMIAEATISVAFATALGSIFPGLGSGIGKEIVVTVLIVGMAIINLYGVPISKLIINTVTVAKLVPLFLFIAIGIFFIKGSNFTPMFPSGHYQFGSFGVAAVTLFYVFTGFERLVVAASDMKNPKKNLPESVFLFVIVVALIYILIQTVTIGILGPDASAKSAVPLQEAFGKVLGGFGTSLIATGTLLSTGGLFIASTYLTPRSGVALAETKMLPKFMAKRNKYGAPSSAILVSMVIVLIVAWSGTFEKLVLISSISRFAQYIPTILAAIVFMRTKKDVEGAFKLPFGPVIPLVALAISIWLLTQVTLEQLVWGLGALVIAVPFYFLAKAQKDARLKD